MELPTLVFHKPLELEPELKEILQSDQVEICTFFFIKRKSMN